MLEEEPESVIWKFNHALTDSGKEIIVSKQKPAISNLIHIYCGFSNQSVQETEAQFKNSSYLEFKQALGKLVADKLTVLQERFKQFRQDEKNLLTIIQKGNQKASKIAEQKIKLVRQKIGLL